MSNRFMQYLLDTNIWIYLFRGCNQISGLVAKIEEGVITPVLHPVCYSETLGWRELDSRQETQIRQYFSSLKMLEIKMNDWEQIIQWRKSGLKRKLPDLIIAATAKRNNLRILTRNVGDFHSLDVIVENPWEPLV